MVGACTLAMKLSDVARPLLSVAVTLMPTLCKAFGAVPLNVAVAALKPSHVGSALPLDWLAV